MLCPMVTRSRQIAPAPLAPLDFFGNCCRNASTPLPSFMALVHHANCQTFPTVVSRWSCQFLLERLAMWPPGHTYQSKQGPPSRNRLVCICCSRCERFVRVALYCQINWISLAVVGGCTALFMVGAILAYDPARGFLARRGEPGGGT